MRYNFLRTDRIHKLPRPWEEELIKSKRPIRRPAVFVFSLFLAGSLLAGPRDLSAQAPAPEAVSANAAGFPSTGGATTPDFWSNRGRWTFGLQAAIAFEIRDPPYRTAHIAILIAQPKVGLILRNFDTPGFPVSRFSVESEGILGGAIHPGGRLIGQALLFHLDGKPVRRLVPFFNCGAGVMNTSINEHARELSGGTQFTPQGGFGVQYFFKPQRAFVIEYRFVHMSNNGIQLPNFGFNSNMVSIGFRWLRRPQPSGPTVKYHSLTQFLFGK
jgi:hypothetical protein